MTPLIPYYDFGGDGPIIHFAHSNGYPPAAFKRFITPLMDSYHVLAVHHRPLWPDITPANFDTWEIIADDMIRFFDQQQLRGVIGVGHSLGAVVTMQAAVTRPELFRALVLIEPVFLMPSILRMVAAKKGPLEETEMPLIHIAKSRRLSWPSRQEAFTHYRPKRVFARWSDEALWDYVYHGMHMNEEGEVTLTYSPEWEATIYAYPPADVWEILPQVQQPTLAIRGSDTETLVPAAWELWQMTQPRAKFVEIPDTGHLLTMEEPQLLAQTILAFLEEQGAAP